MSYTGQYGVFATSGGGGGGGDTSNTIFVDVAGSDANTGLAGSPLKTVYKATLVATAGLIQIGVGTFSEGTNQLKPVNGVSIAGMGAGVTTVVGTNASTTGFAFLNPGNGSYSNFSINCTAPSNSGTTTVAPIGFFTANGDQVATTATFTDVNTSAWSDGVNMSFGSAVAAGPCNWFFEGCNFASSQTVLQSSTSGSHNWAMTCTVQNCNGVGTYDGSTGNNMLVVEIGANTSAGNVFNVNGSTFNSIGGPGGTDRCIDIAGDTVNFADNLVNITSSGSFNRIRNHGGTLNFYSNNGFSPLNNSFSSGVTTFYAGAGLWNLPTVPTTIYVDGKNGDDTNGNGSMAAPYATPIKGVGAATTSGQLVKILDGTYTMTAGFTMSAGVALIGSGRNTTLNFTATTGVSINLPASGATELADFTLITPSTGSNTPIEPSGNPGPTQLVMRNVTAIGALDVIIFNTTGSVTLSMYNCNLTTNSDNINMLGSSANSLVQGFNCNFVGLETGNGTRAFGALKCQHYLYGCYINATGSNSTSGAVQTISGGSLEMHGCTVISNGASTYSLNAQTGTTLSVGPDTKYDQTKTVTAGTGAIVGLIPNILGTGGTTVAVGPAAGAGAGATATLTAGSDDRRGVIKVQTGTAPSATGGLMATLTYGSNKGVTLAPIVSMAETALPIVPYALALGGTAAQIGINSVSVLVGTITYSFAYGN